MARRSDRLTARNVFYIITNGEQTEYNYFKLLKAKRSVYDVKIIFENADPLGLVQYAQRYISEANQVWCVFDIDYTYKDKRLIPALKQAEESGIKIAYSNVAFEVWLISHFEKCKTTLQLDDYIDELDKLLKERGINKTYSKNDEKLLQVFFIPNYKQAMKDTYKINKKDCKCFVSELKKDGDKYWEAIRALNDFIRNTTAFPDNALMNLDLFHNIMLDMLLPELDCDFGVKIDHIKDQYPCAYYIFSKIHNARNQETAAHYKDNKGNIRKPITQERLKVLIDKDQLKDAYIEVFTVLNNVLIAPLSNTLAQANIKNPRK